MRFLDEIAGRVTGGIVCVFSNSRVLSVAYFYVRVFDAPFQGLLVGVRRMCREGFP